MVRAVPATPASARLPYGFLEVGFVSLFFLSLLFAAQFGALGPLLAMALAGGYVFYNQRSIARTLSGNGFLLALPVLGLVSVLWSRYPSATLYYGSQYLISIFIALLIARLKAQSAVIWGIAVAYTLYVGVSVAAGGDVALGNRGDVAFAGLNGGKGFLADTAGLALLSTIFCTVMCLRRRQRVLVLACLALVVVDVAVILVARTAGVVISVAAAIACVMLASVLSRLNASTRTVTAVLFLLVLAWFVMFWSDLSQAIIEFFGKDATLTGRTFLWYRAGQIIEANPILGVGYNGFWVQGNPDAESIWNYFGIASRMGFNFHNTMYELLVTFGFAGLLFAGCVLAFGVVRLMKSYFAAPSLEGRFWICILIYEVVKLPVESIGLAAFNAPAILLFACLAWAPSDKMLRQRSDVPLRVQPFPSSAEGMAR